MKIINLKIEAIETEQSEMKPDIKTIKEYIISLKLGQVALKAYFKTEQTNLENKYTELKAVDIGLEKEMAAVSLEQSN